MKPVSEMTTREKTSILIKLMEWNHRVPNDWEDKNGNYLFSAGIEFDLYLPENMDLAWLVLNWWQSLDERMLYHYGDFQTWFSLPPAKAQAKWLDIILELALKDPELSIGVSDD